jgi:hypothetical protein
MSPVHAQLAREMTRDLRSYRAQQQHRRARAPIIERMRELRAELGMEPAAPDWSGRGE